MRARSLRAAALLGLMALTGCGPALVIRHADPTRAAATVEVDGHQARVLQPGQQWAVSLAPGLHRIELREADGTQPWTEGGEPLWIHLDQDAELVLMPVEVSP